MSGRTLWAVVIAAVVLVALAWFASGRRSTTMEEGPTARREWLMPELRSKLADPSADGAAMVDRIEIERAGDEGQPTLLRRAGAGWIAPEKAEYPLDAERVEAILRGVATLEAAEPLTSDPSRFEALGLEWPAKAGDEALRLRVFAGDALLDDVILGKTKFSPPSIYARRVGENQTWRCLGTVPTERDAVRLMNPVLAQIPAEAIERIEWGDGVVRRDDAGAWIAEGGFAEAKRSDAARVLPELFTRLEFDDVRRPAASGVAAEESILARIGDRTVTIELLPNEAVGGEPGAASDRAQGGRWFRVLVGDAESGLGGVALPEATNGPLLKILAEIRELTRNREFRIPAWRAGRLAALKAQE